MHLRRPLVSVFGWALLATAAWPVRALASDDKEVCLAAADDGQSLRDDSHFMAARDKFLTCAREVCPKIVHDQCTEWLRQLDEAMPTVVFGAKDQRGNDITSVRVLSDGRVVTTTLDGKPLSLDPGPHDIRFERDPSESVTVHVVLRTGEKNREITAAFPSAEGAPAPEEPAAPPSSEASAPNAPFRSGRVIVSASLLASAAVSVGLGAYFGLQSQHENDVAAGILSGFAGRGGTTACNGSASTNQSACADLNRARDAQNTDAVLNDALFVAGGVLAAGAVAAWFLWPKAHVRRTDAAWIVPVLGPSDAGIRVGGSFR